MMGTDNHNGRQCYASLPGPPAASHLLIYPMSKAAIKAVGIPKTPKDSNKDEE